MFRYEIDLKTDRDDVDLRMSTFDDVDLIMSFFDEVDLMMSTFDDVDLRMSSFGMWSTFGVWPPSVGYAWRWGNISK